MRAVDTNVLVRLVTRDDRDAETAGELRDEDGVVVATATARLRIVPRKD